MDLMTRPDPARPAPTSPASSGAAPSGFRALTRLLVGSPRSLPRWAIASLIGNVLIIVTGAVVRLTSSGLGCPTWPRCTAESYVPKGAVTHHAFIEFGNRLITFVLIILAIMTLWSALRHGARRHRWLGLIAAVGIPFQGVIGGITVLTGLDPFVVALHLLLSLALVVLLTWLVMDTWPVRSERVTGAARVLGTAAFGAMMVACWLGTVVTGSGPHSGDGGAARTGFEIEQVARIHSASVWLTVGLTVAALVVLSRSGMVHARRWAVVLLVVELSQGLIGYVQYFTGVPVALVILHMLGAGLSAAAAAALLYAVHRPSTRA